MANSNVGDTVYCTAFEKVLSGLKNSFCKMYSLKGNVGMCEVMETELAVYKLHRDKTNAILYSSASVSQHYYYHIVQNSNIIIHLNLHLYKDSTA